MIVNRRVGSTIMRRMPRFVGVETIWDRAALGRRDADAVRAKLNRLKLSDDRFRICIVGSILIGADATGSAAEAHAAVCGDPVNAPR